MNLKHHFNVYVDVAQLSSKDDLERLITAALQASLPVYLKQSIEVIYCETFDADLEEMGGASSEQLKAGK